MATTNEEVFQAYHTQDGILVTLKPFETVRLGGHIRTRGKVRQKW